MTNGFLAGSAWIDMSVDLTNLVSGLSKAQQITTQTISTLTQSLSQVGQQSSGFSQIGQAATSATTNVSRLTTTIQNQSQSLNLLQRELTIAIDKYGAGALAVDKKQASIDRLSRSLDLNRSSLATATQGVDTFGAAIKTAEAAATSGTSSFAKFGQSVLMGLGIGSGMQIVSTAVREISSAFDTAASSIVGFNSRMEQAQISWTTLLKNGTAATQMLTDIRDIANVTPFRFEGLEAATKTLLAMGVAAKQVLPTMVDIGNVSAAFGLGDEGISRITQAIGEMNTATTVHARNMLMLTSAGIPAYDLLAQAMGKSTAEIQKMMAAGQISSDVFITAFREWSRTNFGDAMALQAHTFQGAISTIADIAQSASATAFKPLFEGISQLAQVIAQIAQTQAFQDWIQRISVVVGNAVTQISAYATVLADIFGIDLPSTIGGASTMLDKYTKSAIDMTSGTVKQTTSVKELNQQLKDAKEAYAVFSNAQVTGTKAYSDALFDLEQQQNRANLNLLEFKAPGAGLDQILNPIQSQIDAADASVKGFASDLDEINSFVKDQEGAVKGAEDALKSYADNVSSIQTEITYHKDNITALKDQYTELTDAIKAQQQALDGWRKTPLVGETAADNAIFAAEQKVKEAQLRLDELKLAGGSKQDIKAAEAQLAALRQQADVLKLQKEVEFDPQHRALEQQGVKVNEATYDQAKTAITNTQAWLDQLQGRVPAVQSALDTEEARLKDAEFRLKAGKAAQAQQQQVVDAEKATLDHLKETRDKINESYTTEKNHLKDLNDLYKDSKDKALKPYEDAIKSLGNAADQLKLREKLDLGGPARDVQSVLKPIKEMSSDAIIAGLQKTGAEVARIQGLLDKMGTDDTGGGVTGAAPAPGTSRRVGGEQTDPAGVTTTPAQAGGVAGGMQSFKDFGKAVDDARLALSGFAAWMQEHFPGLSVGPKHLGDDMRETRDKTKSATDSMMTEVGTYAKNSVTFWQQITAVTKAAWKMVTDMADWMVKNWGPTFDSWQKTATDTMTHFITVTLPNLWGTLQDGIKTAADAINDLWDTAWGKDDKSGIRGIWSSGLTSLTKLASIWLGDASGKDSWLVAGAKSWGDIMVTAWEDGITMAWPKFMTFLGQQFASLIGLIPDFMKPMLGIGGGTSGGGGSSWGTSANPDAINKLLSNTGLAGEGETIARLAAQYNISPSLALAMFKKEANYAAPGSSAAANNNPGNLRGSPLESGESGGFAVFKDMATGIEAYFKLLNDNYRQFLDKGDIGGLINKYAPPSENNTAQYIQQITDWIKSIAAAIGASGGTPGTIGNGNPADDPRPSQAGINTVVPGAQLGDTYDADRGALGAHQGLDLQIKNGTPVHVPLDLTNIRVGYYADAARQGYYVIGDDAFGREWYFGHLTSVTVHDGGSIAKGGTIGTVGMGHVHVQLRQVPGGPPIDPSAALDAAAQAPPPAPPQDTGSSYNGTSTGSTDMYASQGMSIGGPNFPVLAGQIGGVTASASNLAPILKAVNDAIAAYTGNVTDATAATSGFQKATNDVMAHADYLNGLIANVSTYIGAQGGKTNGLVGGVDLGKGKGKNAGPDPWAGPHFGDPITTGRDSGLGLGKGWKSGIEAATPDIQATTKQMFQNLQDNVILPWQNDTRDFFSGAGFGFIGAVSDGVSSASGGLSNAAGAAGGAAGAALKAGLDQSVPGAVATIGTVQSALDGLQDKTVTITVNTVHTSDGRTDNSLNTGLRGIGLT